MTYIMTMCEGEDNVRLLPRPQAKLIAQAVDNLIPKEFHFVILEADPPVEQCAYVQTLIEREGKFTGQYLVESRYEIDRRSSIKERTSVTPVK